MLAFRHTHTEESLALVYWEKGSYLPEALTRINRLCRDFRTGEIHAMDPALFDLLNTLQRLTAPESQGSPPDSLRLSLPIALWPRTRPWPGNPVECPGAASTWRAGRWTCDFRARPPWLCSARDSNWRRVEWVTTQTRILYIWIQALCGTGKQDNFL